MTPTARIDVCVSRAGGTQISDLAAAQAGRLPRPHGCAAAATSWPSATTARYRCSAMLISLIEGASRITRSSGVEHQRKQHSLVVGRVGLEPTTQGL
jgi:hypothetical protein